MRRKWGLRVTIGISIVISLICISGFMITVKDMLFRDRPSTVSILKPDEKSETKTFTIVGLGDSLTRGIGDEDGQGYIGIVKDKLSTTWNRPISLLNLAVSGAKSQDLITLLKKEGTQYTLKKASVVVLTMGGNDLFPGVDNLDKINPTMYTGNIKQFSEDVKTIIELIQTVNPTASIYWLSLYNPFADIKELNGSQTVTLAWNQTLEQIAQSYPHTYIIPTYDIFQGQLANYLYTDHFHPNKAGYEQMAERLFQKIQSQFK